WLERGSQKMLWRAVSAAVACEAAGEGTRAPPCATLELDPSLQLPDWYTEWDIHLQPGGVWSSDTAARVYELGAKLVMLGENDDYLFHRLFASTRSEEHTSELQSRRDLVCRLLLEKKNLTRLLSLL